MTDTKKKTIWSTIGISLVVFLSVYFIVSIRGNINTYKSEIKSLERTRDSLQRVIQYRVDPDSVANLLVEQESMNIQIEDLSNKIDSLKKKYDEKNWNNVYSLSTDSNIVILSKLLSEKDTHKQ